MFNFGIDGYEPHWLHGHTAIAEAHGGRLAGLRGRRLTDAWVVWDHHDDTWFADCPVLLDFDGEQVEINHYRLDELSITWNTADPRRSVTWSTPGDLRLAWRADALGLDALRGHTLQEVALLEWTGEDLARGMVAVWFGFPTSQVTIHNALDENGLSFAPPRPQYRRRSLNP